MKHVRDKEGRYATMEWEKSVGRGVEETVETEEEETKTKTESKRVKGLRIRTSVSPVRKWT